MFRVLTLAAIMLLLFVGEGFSTRVPPPPPPQEPVTTVKENILPPHEHTEKCNETSAEPVQIICILDRSGSMSSLTSDTIGGYNSFIEKQKQQAGKAQLTTVLFDNQYEKIVDGADLNDVRELTSAEYYARGTTALLDAVGMTITDILGKMERDGVCPAKRRVLIMIMTDGYENASKEYSKADVKSLVEATTKNYNWNYIFMGANIDSVAEAGSIGIRPQHAANYRHDSEGVKRSFEQMDEAAKAVREKGTLDKN